ncbi:MAG: glycosyltransferase [Pseudomonadota bacterium]|nr:glycosyltransferase [Pseudomonadota bacterium]
MSAVNMHAVAMQSALSQVTVVVPVGPGDTLTRELRAQLSLLPPAAQVCVVCSDEPSHELIGAGLRSTPGPQWQCLLSPRGRALQQNAGALAASRSWLWFVHADSVLAPDTLPALARWIQRDIQALAYFDLRFLDDGPALMWLNTSGAWLRSRLLGLPFGDQGLVFPRALFEALGRFNTVLAGGEDHALVWRARRTGVPLRPLRAPIYTSARKYAEHGWGATTGTHLRETWKQARRFSRVERSR